VAGGQGRRMAKRNVGDEGTRERARDCCIVVLEMVVVGRDEGETNFIYGAQALSLGGLLNGNQGFRGCHDFDVGDRYDGSL
jgi:hypothetical protein